MSQLLRCRCRRRRFDANGSRPPRAGRARCRAWFRRCPADAVCSFVDSAFHRSTTSRNRVAATPPHTDGGTLLIRPMNDCSIARISSLRASILPATAVIRSKSVLSDPPAGVVIRSFPVFSDRSCAFDGAQTCLVPRVRRLRAPTGSLPRRRRATASFAVRARFGSRRRFARCRRRTPPSRSAARRGVPGMSQRVDPRGDHRVEVG